ncbi:hypothetical protein [Rhodoferax sp.]|uniref:hypothetical protein n=1 Tax=Rhodoferax sp. TaxID=50421 RepID=UPI001EC73488|nr:hypothetical protein [Rhodoferax sp.]MBT9508246.1 hypothetical protein [Rhodoferax sp.]
MNTDVERKTFAVQKKFPSRAVLIFMLIQVLTGLVISFITFDEYQWVREVFIPIDHNFRAFRTMFSKAPEPIAGKVFLLIWWGGFIPWGIAWTARFTDGFRPTKDVISRGKIATLKLLTLCGVGLLMLVYLNAYADYGSSNISSGKVPSRADIIPTFIGGGAFTVSIWLALNSPLLLVTMAGVIAGTRALIQQTFLHGNKK